MNIDITTLEAVYEYIGTASRYCDFIARLRSFLSSTSANNSCSSFRRCIDNRPSAIPTVNKLSSGYQRDKENKMATLSRDLSFLVSIATQKNR